MTTREHVRRIISAVCNTSYVTNFLLCGLAYALAHLLAFILLRKTELLFVITPVLFAVVLILYYTASASVLGLTCFITYTLSPMFAVVYRILAAVFWFFNYANKAFDEVVSLK